MFFFTLQEIIIMSRITLKTNALLPIPTNSRSSLCSPSLSFQGLHIIMVKKEKFFGQILMPREMGLYMI